MPEREHSFLKSAATRSSVSLSVALPLQHPPPSHLQVSEPARLSRVLRVRRVIFDYINPVLIICHRQTDYLRLLNLVFHPYPNLHHQTLTDYTLGLITLTDSHAILFKAVNQLPHLGWQGCDRQHIRVCVCVYRHVFTMCPPPHYTVYPLTWAGFSVVSLI